MIRQGEGGGRRGEDLPLLVSSWKKLMPNTSLRRNNRSSHRVIFTPVTVPRMRLPDLFFIRLHSRVLHWAVTESPLFDHYADHRNLLARYPHGR